MQAVLIDGDNLSAQHAAAILTLAPQAQVRRVYCGSNALKPWAEVPALTCIHAADGRNAADIRLALDAMDLWHAGLREVVLATSDAGLACLAVRLREGGATVTLAGEAKAPPRLRQAAQRFVELPAVVAALAIPVALPAPAAALTEPKPTTPPALRPRAATLEERVVTLLAGAGPAGLPLTSINGAMYAVGVHVSTLPEKTWRAWLEARPAHFALDPRGPEARVRLAAR